MGGDLLQGEHCDLVGHVPGRGGTGGDLLGQRGSGDPLGVGGLGGRDGLQQAVVVGVGEVRGPVAVVRLGGGADGGGGRLVGGAVGELLRGVFHSLHVCGRAWSHDESRRQRLLQSS